MVEHDASPLGSRSPDARQPPVWYQPTHSLVDPGVGSIACALATAACASHFSWHVNVAWWQFVCAISTPPPQLQYPLQSRCTVVAQPLSPCGSREPCPSHPPVIRHPMHWLGKEGAGAGPSSSGPPSAAHSSAHVRVGCVQVLCAARAPPSHSQYPDQPLGIPIVHGRSPAASRGPDGTQPAVWRHEMHSDALTSGVAASTNAMRCIIQVTVGPQFNFLG